jgi:hypothetical protein
MTTILFKAAAAAPAPFTAFTLSTSAAGDVPTATATAAAGRIDFVLGDATTFYNATIGKNANDPIIAGDIVSAYLPYAQKVIARTAASIADGVLVAAGAAGIVEAIAPTTDTYSIGVTLGARTGAGEIELLYLPRGNPAFVPA